MSGPYIKRQKKWLEATQLRVGFTSSVISSMKGVKIMGLIEKMQARLRALRLEEVQRAKKQRLFYALFTVLQTLSLSGTRWITYTVFGIIAILSSEHTGLGINRLFMSLAILNIFMERLEIFLRQMPSIASSFGCLRRIENFLLLETKRDDRLIAHARLSSSKGYELQDIQKNETSISMRDLSVGWNMEKAELQGLTVELPLGSFTIVIGP
jgi:ATP-binding cassette subfamily C (CFTR/MRP) protein 1